jgi:energy-coupling factor transporter ATP-binding protein EcfA2
MLKRLKIKNYASIGEADLELAPFTVIVGSNQAGKSNVLRALRAIASNKTGRNFIRHGTSEATVEVTTEEGDVITWTKSKTTAEYDLNGQRFTKLAGAVPEEISTALNIKSVEVDASLTVWPQLHTQGEYAFLIPGLGVSPGQVARAIAKMTRLDVVVKAQQLCKARIRDIKERHKISSSEVTRAEGELEEFDDLTDIGEVIEEATTKRVALVDKVALFTAGRISLRDIAEASNLPELPDEEGIDQVRGNLRLVEDAGILLAELDKELPPDVPDVTPLRELLVRYETSYAAHKTLFDNTLEFQRVNDKLLVCDHDHAEAQREWEKYAGEICPVCGGIL